MAAKFKFRTLLIYTACIALLGLLGWLDYLTGYELGFFVFYSAPVGVAARKLGRWPAVGMSLLASLAWALAGSYGVPSVPAGLPFTGTMASLLPVSSSTL